MLDVIEHGPVRELRLNRPPVNALSPALLRALRNQLKRAAEDEVGGLVFSGQPGIFTAGLDVPTLLNLNESEMGDFWIDFHGSMEDIARSPIPIVAAITGHSPAGGSVLVIFCDYRIAARGDFQMGLNEVRVGLPVSPHILQAYGRLVGPHNMEKLAMTGTMVSPERALNLGLVDELTTVDETVPRAILWAKEVAGLPPTSMRLTRKSARSELVGYFDALGPMDVDFQNSIWFSKETQNTMRGLVARLKAKNS